MVGSDSRRLSFGSRPRRRLLIDTEHPWGAAGYSFSAGVPVTATAGGPMDRNVPRDRLLEWQAQRSTQRRLPATATMCVPLWVKWNGEPLAVGVGYLSTLRATIRLAMGGMIKTLNRIEDGPA